MFRVLEMYNFGSCIDQMRAQKHGDDGIEEEVNFSVQNSSSRCQIGIDVKHHSLKIVSSTKNDFEILICCLHNS